MAKTYKIVHKGFRHSGTCASCQRATDMRDQRDGYLLISEDGDFEPLCRWCNAYVHSAGSEDAYAVDEDGDFCRTGKRFRRMSSSDIQHSSSGTQPEDLDDGSAFV